MTFVCKDCRTGDHDKCPGNETCDCQHRSGSKTLRIVAGLVLALAVTGCAKNTPTPPPAPVVVDEEDCDAEDRAKRQVLECGPGVLGSTKKVVTPTKKVTVTGNFVPPPKKKR